MNGKKESKDRLYTTGEINRIIDTIFHPFYEENQWFRLVDGAVHAAVEGDFRRSAKKFVKYNLPEIAKIVLKTKSKKR